MSKVEGLLSLVVEIMFDNMDDEIINQVDTEPVQYTEEEYLTRYMEQHLLKFAEEFTVADRAILLALPLLSIRSIIPAMAFIYIYSMLCETNSIKKYTY